MSILDKARRIDSYWPGDPDSIPEDDPVILALAEYYESHQEYWKCFTRDWTEASTAAQERFNTARDVMNKLRNE